MPLRKPAASTWVTCDQALDDGRRARPGRIPPRCPGGWAVSRRRQPRGFRWFDEHGHVHVERRVEKVATLASTAPPRRTWLTAAYDPLGHLVAVVAANAGLPPVVYSGATGSPAFVLLPDGLCAALVSLENETTTVSPIGTPRAEFLISCPACRHVEYVLDADQLHASRGPKPGKFGALKLAWRTP